MGWAESKVTQAPTVQLVVGLAGGDTLGVPFPAASLAHTSAVYLVPKLNDRKTADVQALPQMICPLAIAFPEELAACSCTSAPVAATPAVDGFQLTRRSGATPTWASVTEAGASGTPRDNATFDVAAEAGERPTGPGPPTNVTAESAAAQRTGRRENRDFPNMDGSA
jgi:hypothetical protein